MKSRRSSRQSGSELRLITARYRIMKNRLPSLQEGAGHRLGLKVSILRYLEAVQPSNTLGGESGAVNPSELCCEKVGGYSKAGFAAVIDSR